MVFITTFDRLLPEWDRNSKRDLYVAMPDGGFAFTRHRHHPAARANPASPDSPRRRRPLPGRGREEGNLQRGLATATLVKGGKSIRVGVLAPGRVTATLSGKLGKGKPTTVSKASKVASKAGALSLPVRLSQRASKLLSERGRLPLTLTVTHVQSDQTITRKVTLHGDAKATGRPRNHQKLGGMK